MKNNLNEEKNQSVKNGQLKTENRFSLGKRHCFCVRESLTQRAALSQYFLGLIPKKQPMPSSQKIQKQGPHDLFDLAVILSKLVQAYYFIEGEETADDFLSS